MATVRFVGTPSGLSWLGDESASHAENADGVASAERPEATLRDLPLRPAGHRCCVPGIRCLDDPEILERVLEGLIKLT